MKKILLSIVCIAAYLVTANAQALGNAQFSATEDTGFSSAYLIYSPAKYYGKNADSDSFMRFALGRDKATPLPIDNFNAYTVLGMMVEWYNESDKDTKSASNIVGLKVPFSLMLKLKLSDEMSLLPYVGVNAALGVIGRLDIGSDHYSLYSKDDLGDYVYRRFLFGWQVGTRVNLRGGYALIGFEKSFSDVGKNINAKVGGLDIGIGIYL